MNATPTLLSRQEQLVEHRFAESIDELLRRLYVDEGLTQQQIAERLDVHVRSVVRWMAKHHIPTRDRRALATEVASA